MGSVLAAETTVLAHFESVRIVFLVFRSIVIALLAFRTCQGYFYSHLVAPPGFLIETVNTVFILPQWKKLAHKKSLSTEVNLLYHNYFVLSIVFVIFFIFLFYIDNVAFTEKFIEKISKKVLTT